MHQDFSKESGCPFTFLAKTIICVWYHIKSLIVIFFIFVQVKGKGLRESEEYELEVFKLFQTSKIDKETICAVCEKNDNADLECSGTCHQFFHLNCVGLTAQTKTYKCGECTSGN